MKITNSASGTNLHEIADSIYRISTPVTIVPGGFSSISTSSSMTSRYSFTRGRESCSRLFTMQSGT